MVDKELILRKLKDYKKFKSDAEFARYIGIGPTVLATWYKRNTFNINKIANVFPEVSQDWLLTGNGEMLKENTSQSSDELELYKKLIASLEETVASQKLIIQKLQNELIQLQRANIHQRSNMGTRRAASASPDEELI